MTRAEFDVMNFCFFINEDIMIHLRNHAYAILRKKLSKKVYGHHNGGTRDQRKTTPDQPSMADQTHFKGVVR